MVIPKLAENQYAMWLTCLLRIVGISLIAGTAQANVNYFDTTFNSRLYRALKLVQALPSFSTMCFAAMLVALPSNSVAITPIPPCQTACTLATTIGLLQCAESSLVCLAGAPRRCARAH